MHYLKKMTYVKCKYIYIYIIYIHLVLETLFNGLIEKFHLILKSHITCHHTSRRCHEVLV